ncbi:hypothetical protein [Brevundimonas sp.]|uniref:hypothetical protein n=1 Tax=Brevundimonas sp. TaxID=1871086 RepID=UPI003D6CCC52
MKICVFGPSRTYVNSAGARIRYRRIQKWLELLGHSIEIQSISDISSARSLTADAFIFSKCYDARVTTIGRMLNRAGKLVGVDLFDDIFSQTTDARLLHRRLWLSQMAEGLDFALCSTPRMRDVASQFLPREACHVMNDPFGEFDPQALAPLLQAKLDRARAERRIDVAWFGQGDNPRYPVGLRDLAAYGENLRLLAEDGWDVRLNILTNRKSLTAAGLEQLQRLSVPHGIHEWSIDAEARLLKSALLAYIPVNCQAFSIAKSLNRAVSALTHGAQVLSDGHPLYRQFDDLIYDRPKDLASDLEKGELRLRSGTLPTLIERMSEWGDPDVETTRLSDFLASRLAMKQTSPDAGVRPIAVVHGIESPLEVNAVLQALDYLTIGSPMAREGRRYDLDLVLVADELVLRLTPEAASRIAPAFAQALTPAITPEGEPRFDLALTDLLEAGELEALHPIDQTQPLRRHIHYGPAMEAMMKLCGRLLPDTDILISEVDPIAAAFSLAPADHRQAA